MEQNISSAEKTRRQFYEDLKQEDIDEVYERSLKSALNLFRRIKLSEDPWMYCFKYDESMPDKFGGKSSIRLDSSKNLRDKLRDMINNSSGVTDEELNHCKAALKREARFKNLPELFGKAQELRLLHLNFSEAFPKNYEKQRKLHGEIVCDTTDFELSLKDGLESLKPFSNIKLSADTTFEDTKDNITKMIIMMQDLQTFVDLAKQNLCKVIEKFEMYQELEEKIDHELFTFLAHFFAHFMLPRSMRKKSK